MIKIYPSTSINAFQVSKKPPFLSIIISFAILLLSANSIWSQATVQTYNTSGTFTVPAGVTSIQVEAWGAGGAGGGAQNGNTTAGSGGGGGGYALLSNITVTPFQSIPYTVGGGGNGSSDTNGTAGGNSTILTINALGGGGGARRGGAAGAFGSATGGSTNTNGTAGTVSGAGGAGGNGGAGGAVATNGTGGSGTIPGGGGGGGKNNSIFTFTGRAGGDGANGRIRITYTQPTITSFFPTGCVSQGTTVTITGTNLSGATVVKFNGTTASIITNTATSITATVPAGATSGNIVVTVPTGFATSAIFSINPSVAAISGSSTVCRLSTTNLTDTTAGGTWSSSNNLIATVNASGVVTGVTAGSVTISYAVTVSGCTTTVTKPITVNPTPVLSGPASICISDNTAAFTSSTGSGTWSTGSPSVATIDNTGLVTPVSQGTTTFTFTDGTTSCTATTGTINIVAPAAVGIQPAITQTVCAGDPVALSISATGGNLSYQWYNGASTVSNGGGISGATTNSLSFSAVTVANGSSNYFCRVTNTCGSIDSNPAQIIVNVKPVIPTQNASVCSDDSFSVAPANGVPTAAVIVPAGTSYSWSAPVVTGGITGGASGSAQSNISGNLHNPTNTAQTATYTVTPTSGSSGSCIGNPFAVVVTVNPLPFIINQTASVCSGEIFSFIPTNGSGNIVPSGTTFSWSAPTVTGGLTGGSALSGQTSIIQTLTNPTNAVQMATYNVTATSGVCIGSTFTLVLTVNPKPTVDSSLPTQTICSGNAITPLTFSNPNSVSGTTTYSWTRDNTANISGIPNGGGNSVSGILTNLTGVQQTTILTFYATSEEGCISTAGTTTVIVDPSPIVSPIASQNICSGNNIATVNINSSVATATYTWTRTPNANLTGIALSGSGNSISGSFTNLGNVPQATTFTIVPTSGGCNNPAGSATFTITVKPLPMPTAAPATQTICGGGSFSITASDTNNVSGTTYSFTYNSQSGDNATISGNVISGTLINNASTDHLVTFDIIATANGCPSLPTTVTVNVTPNPVFTATPVSQFVCSGAPFSIALPAVAGVTYDWTRTNILSAGNLSGISDSMTNVSAISGTFTNLTTANQTTTFTITATINGCSRTSTASVTIYPPLTSPVIAESQTVCSGSRPTPFAMTTLPTGGDGTYSYQWQSAPASSGPWTDISGATASSYWAPTTSAATPATYYRLMVKDVFCNNTTLTSNYVTVSVANGVNFTFTITNGGTTVCPGSAFNPTITSGQFLPDSYVKYGWTADINYISPSTGAPIGTTNTFYFFGFPLYSTSTATLPLTTINNTNANVTTTVYITPNVYDLATNAFICSLSAQTTTVTIRPKPVATVTSPAAGTTICSGTSAGMTVTGNITSETMSYTITRTVNANVTSSKTFPLASGNIAVGASYTLNDILTNTSTTAQTVTYSIVPKSNSGCTGTATTFTITISPVVNPGTIGTNQTICSGDDPALLTEITPASGSGTLAYQWFTGPSATGPWTAIGGATATTYDPPAGLTATTYYIRQISSTVNSVTCPVANATPVRIIVNTISAGIIAGNQTICSGGDPVAFTVSTAATGTSAPTYQWQSNTTGCAGIWSDISGATGATYDAPAGLTVTTYYRRIATSTTTGVPCSDYSNCIIVTINTVTGGVVGSDQSLCGSSNNPALFTEITPSIGGLLSYQWQSNTVSATGPWSNITGATSATYDAPAGLTVTTYYHRVTTSILNGVQCTADSNTITVNAGSVTGGAISGNRTVCSGGDPAPFTEISPATGTALTYQWQISLSGLAGSWTDISGATANTYDAPGPITQNTYYQRIATGTVGVTTCNAASNFVTVFVNSVAPSVIAGDQTVCGDDPVAFTVTTPASGNTLTYQWQSSTVSSSGPWGNISGATSPTYDSPVLSLTTYFHVVVTSTLNAVQCTATSNTLTVTSLAKTWNGSAGSNWNAAGSWTPSGVPDATNCVIIPSVVNNPVISSNAIAYNLTLLTGAILQVNPTYSLTVTDVVKVNSGAQFLVKDSADLIQINNVVNVGNINMERITQPIYRFDYTYWGSPMTQASNFTLGLLSPNTLSDKYFSWNPTVSNSFGTWNPETMATIMDPRKGYIVRAPQTFSYTSAVKVPYTANFIGTPNNGDILCPIYHGTLGAGNNNDKYNLLGNPYPSAVDADLFLSDPANVPVIDGTIYFWTHNSPPSTAYADPFYGDYVINYTATDYASWNKLGGTGTAATTGGATPNGYIAAGQGFFAKSTGTATSGNPVIFKNSMRTSGHNGQFFRFNNTASFEKHRIWLNLVDSGGTINQILVGYAEGATEGWDRDFDGARISDTGMILYSIIPDQNLVIQGRPLPFNAADLVPLGYKTTSAGNYSIRIDHLDGLFENQNVYLEDTVLNVIHNLKESPYVFAADAGTFNDRFILRYTDTLLAVQNPEITDGLVALIIDGKLQVEASDSIDYISVFDITGKFISDYRPETGNKNFESNFNYSEGIYMIKIKLHNGDIVTQKLINRK